MNQNPQYNQSRQSQGSASRGNAFIRTWNWLCLNIVVPYLDNCSAELISKSSQVKLCYETNLLNEETRVVQQDT